MAVEFILTFGIFFAFSATPPPDVNEAHYLAKAKHFWNHDWCPNDHFLNSSDAHATFFFAFGWVTRFTSLSMAAWIGRCVVCGLLAVGWRSISVAICNRPLSCVLSACVYALLTKYGHMSGEWVLGGVEAKGFAYGFALLGIGGALRGNWNRCWCLLGISSAFHVLVGGWTVVALFFAWLIWRDESKPKLFSMVPGLVAGGLASLAGLLPAILLTTGAAPEDVAKGEYVYVFERLGHHLLISQFPSAFVTRHLILFLASVMLYFVFKGHSRIRLLFGLIFGAALIAIAGVCIDASCGSNQRLAARLLKFYWYRATDAYAPMGAACAVPLLLGYLAKPQRRAVNVIAWLMVFVVSYEIYPSVFPRYPRADTQSGLVRNAEEDRYYQDWLTLCEWIDENVADDAVFITPERQQTFKWYAGRAEVATWKDVPQDGAGIVEWLERHHELAKFKFRGVYLDHERRLRRNRAKFGATHYVLHVERTPQPELAELYSNGTFKVYEIPQEENDD